MSELLPTHPVPPEALVSPERPTAGALLTAARQRQGLHVAALAVTLKVPVRKLEALEADHFDELPDLVFVRALAASVCRVLKVDPIPVLAALPQTAPNPVMADPSGLNTPFKTNRFELGQKLKLNLVSPLSLAVIGLILAIFVVLWWPVSPEPASVLPDPAFNGQTEPGLGALPGPAPETPALAASGAGAIVLQDSPRLSAPIQSGVAVPASVAAVPGALGPALLLLQSRGSSWVEVTDAQGVLQVRKTLTPGEQIQLAGALPLAVVLGRADEVDVSVRGERLDLSAVTKTNVARFEVK